jgi:hypothetical protein
LPSGVPQTAHLPGGVILLHRELLEDYDDPDVVAGYILAETLRAEQSDSLQHMLSFTGTLSVFRLLTTGQLSETTLKQYAEHLLLQSPSQIDMDLLIEQFSAQRLRAAPYAYALDVTGEQTLALIEADDAATVQFEPSLSDNYWIRLQTICGG